MLAILKANLLATVLGLAAAIFLVISVVQSVQINGFLWWDGLRDEIEECAKDRAELKRISDAKNEQRQRTDENIKQSEKRIQISDKKAREIEEAPTAPNCETPPEIMRADI